MRSCLLILVVSHREELVVDGLRLARRSAKSTQAGSIQENSSGIFATCTLYSTTAYYVQAEHIEVDDFQGSRRAAWPIVF